GLSMSTDVLTQPPPVMRHDRERRDADDGGSRLDILLINPPWQTRDGNIWHGVKSTSPPLGLLYVAAYARDKGRSVRVMDVNAEGLSFEDIEAVVREHRPAWVGLTAVTAQITSTHQVAEMVKRVSPTSRVVVGGVHATALPEEVLRDDNVDYVIRGEGEVSFFELVAGRPSEAIGGLSYRGSNPLQPVEHNAESEPITDLDSLPTPAYDLIPFELYQPAIGAYRRLPAINMTMTRGCPGKCTFCNSAETALRTRSAEHIVDEIQSLQRRYAIREVSFYDDTFTIYKQNVARMCELIVQRGLDLTWSCFARTDCISPPLLAKMKSAGCHQILFGIESADPEILRTIRKPIDLEMTRAAVRMVQQAGIAVRAAFMFGNPGETVESIRRTIDFAKELDPDIAIFNITTPYPGTQMFEWAKRNGHLRTLDWNDYDLANSVMELPTISSERINRMYKLAYREFFFRPSYLLRRLWSLRSFEDLKVNVRAFRSILFARTTAPVTRWWRRGDSRSAQEALPAATAEFCA
ncbi:MAG: B12-binding domain-containing radical SAM protein, partial [Phycisphaerae bacterium]